MRMDPVLPKDISFFYYIFLIYGKCHLPKVTSNKFAYYIMLIYNLCMILANGFVLVVTLIVTPIRGNHPIKAPLDQQNISYVTGNTWNNLPKTINNKHVHEFSSFFKVIKSYSFRTYQNNCT